MPEINDKKYINQLVDFLLADYGIQVKDTKLVKRGIFAETWAVTSDMEKYFVKIVYSQEQSIQYSQSLAVLQQVTEEGIDYVPKIIKNLKNELFSLFNSGVLSIYEFLEGKNTYDYELNMLFDKLAYIYKNVNITAPIEIEYFDTQIVRDCYDKIELAKSGIINKYEQQFINCINNLRDIFFFRTFRLNLFSNLCKHEPNNFYLTHGDPSGNCIVKGNNLTIVDWDTPKIAPPERDAWIFICDDRIDLINDSLKKNGIDYTLNKNRLAYYCYYSYFTYIYKYLTRYNELSDSKQKNELLAELIDYLENGWINNRLKAADAIL